MKKKEIEMIFNYKKNNIGLLIIGNKRIKEKDLSYDLINKIKDSIYLEFDKKGNLCFNCNEMILEYTDDKKSEVESVLKIFELIEDYYNNIKV